MITIYETQHPTDFSLMYDTVLIRLNIQTKQSRGIKIFFFNVSHPEVL